jgi:hypothetical protein
MAAAMMITPKRYVAILSQCYRIASLADFLYTAAI